MRRLPVATTFQVCFCCVDTSFTFCLALSVHVRRRGGKIPSECELVSFSVSLCHADKLTFCNSRNVFCVEQFPSSKRYQNISQYTYLQYRHEYILSVKRSVSLDVINLDESVINDHRSVASLLS